MKNKIYTICILLLAFFCAEINSQTLAFPTAEGFGAYASGGRGGKVVEVTNLEDDANGTIEGSFRWALKQHEGEPITVVFRVSGVIDLKAQLRCKRNNYTIAGQTAPGDGICLKGNKVNFGGSNNFIIRHLRFRIGIMLKADGTPDASGNGSIGIENASNFIVDHCTFGWSGEENMTVYDNHYSTIQWCIVHEGLYVSGHNKGARSYATQWGGSPATYHHNLIAHHVSRSVRFNGASNISGDRNVLLDYVNNVNYNWASSGACYGGEREVNGATHECNFVNNYYKRGPATSGTTFIAPSRNRSGKTSVGPSIWYLSGNKMVESDGTIINNVTNDNWAGIRNNSGYTIDEIKSLSPIVIEDKYQLKNVDSADDAYLAVLENAGAFPRDAVDLRIIDETRNGIASGKGTKETYFRNGVETPNPYYNVEKGIIDEPDAVGGYPVYNTNEVPIDSDHDGMPDAWEIEKGLDPNDATDGNKLTTSGYTALEVYLNGLVGEEIPLEFVPSSIETEKIKEQVQVSLKKGILILNAENPIKKVSVFDAQGKLILSQTNPDTTINMSHYAVGTYIVKILSDSNREFIFKVLR